ncbi:MAG TPA: methionine--tRNA ligase, partial [Candidatus Dormibacteraeota bacterium]|nr:methionine--tRNA ligase [Candidatus Dormibacteraeota bacterium]
RRGRSPQEKHMKFYVTTPIYYVNDRPHVGHYYTTMVADVLARYHRLRGDETFLLTGTDEHSLNVDRKAKAEGVPTRDFVDRMAAQWQLTWSQLGISNDDFIRTTEPRHRAGVEDLVRRVREAGDIFESTYEGPYCVSCERFYLEKDLVDGRCPLHPSQEIQHLKERNHFFRLSAFADRLRQHIEEHPDFVQPDERRNEVLATINGGLEDFSMSRQSLEWGIPFPDDPEQVVYVWFDALTNYMTAVGYGTDEAQFRHLWPADLHLIGKDIIRFHAIYWPAMLMSAGLPLPKTVFAHGFLYFKGRKLSKSEGVMLSPFDLAAALMPAAAVAAGAEPTPAALDAVRFVLLRHVPFGRDGDVTYEALVDRYNADLANDLGNLASRVLKMLKQYTAGVVPEPGVGVVGPHAELRELADGIAERVDAALLALDFARALDETWRLVSRANRYVEESKPWELRKDEARAAELDTVLYNLTETLRLLTYLMAPYLPWASEALALQLRIPPPATVGGEGQPLAEVLRWGGLKAGHQTVVGDVLFPRLDRVTSEG